MLGADWLIFPTLVAGANSVRGYMPAGKWIPLWSMNRVLAANTSALHADPSSWGVAYGSVHGPGWQQLPAPLGQPAVYHRLGASSAKSIRAALHELKVLEPLHSS